MPEEPSSPDGGGIVMTLAVEAGDWPAEEDLRQLAEKAIAAAMTATDTGGGRTLDVLFTDDENIRALNARFRGRDKTTNVLSFPASAGMASPGQPPHLGDIAIAFETVAREAEAEKKVFDHHLTHLIIHGFLHLAGYDHQTPSEADEMEGLETSILKGLAIGDPYA